MQELKKRYIDIINDHLLQEASHVSQRDPPLLPLYIPVYEPTSLPPNSSPNSSSLSNTIANESATHLKWEILLSNYSNSALGEVSGPEGSICVHELVNVNDIQQCREKLGRYPEDPDKFTIEFQTLVLGFDLPWRDTHFFLANCCIFTERKRILTAAHMEADEAFARDP
jgi:hypothetical protein